MKWHGRFLDVADILRTWSKDPSTGVGCVVVGPDREIRSTGFNGFPRGILDDAERLNDRDTKIKIVCHAEENAIFHAARIGVSLKGCSLYVSPWPPCSKCSRAIIQSGIESVFVRNSIQIPERWKSDFELSRSLLKEANVKVILL